MKTINTPVTQQGFVLVFSLVMLLLITLLGTNMILQNRTQLMMVANKQAQTTAFANVEDLLQLAEGYIATQRYDGAALQPFTCNKNAAGAFVQLQPGDITDAIGLTQDMIDAGVTVAITQTACMVTGATENVCTWTWDDTDFCNRTAQAMCPTEVYTMLITAQDTATGSNRMIESKYAVRCDF